MSGRVLVTGGAGFIGSHLCEAYRAAGWTVTALDDLSRGKASNLPPDVPLVRADIRSAEARDAVADGRFDVLNHHAAQIDVRVSVDEPDLDASINLVGLVNLLRGVAKGGVKRVVFASSGGVVYGDPDVIPTSESAAKAPISPYGVSKLASEHYLRALSLIHGFETVALRYANIFGPRQDPKSEAGVISIFISRMLAGQPITIFGDGAQTRDYVFVRDVARANVLASTAALTPPDGIDARAFNIGTGRELSVNALADRCAAVLGVRGDRQHVAPRAGELSRNAINPLKAKQALGWEAAHAFDDGLRAVADWFRAGTP